MIEYDGCIDITGHNETQRFCTVRLRPRDANSIDPDIASRLVNLPIEFTFAEICYQGELLAKDLATAHGGELKRFWLETL